MDDEAGEMGEAVLVRIREAAAPLKIGRSHPRSTRESFPGDSLGVCVELYMCDVCVTENRYAALYGVYFTVRLYEVCKS